MKPIAMLVLGLALLAGCASVPRDAGFSDVEKALAGRLDQKPRWNRNGEDDKAAEEAVQSLLNESLSADSAVQIALLNNRGLQATYGELGVVQADLVQAGLLQNPVFSASRIRSSAQTTTDLAVEVGFLGVLLRSKAKELESARFEATKLRVADEVLRTATEVRTAYFRSLASQQGAGIFESVLASSEAAAELAAKQYNAGNLNLRAQARQQAMYVETRAQLGRARQQAASDRERVNRLLGLWGTQTQWTLPAKLPGLPAIRPEYADLEAIAIGRRLDVAVARKDVEYVGHVLGITRSARYISVLDVGIASEKSSGEPSQIGPTLRLELPLFDQGQARVAKYEAVFDQAANRLAETAVNARAETRERYNDLLYTWDLATQQQGMLLPLRRRILAQTQLFYNGMLEGVYELLADYRESALAARDLVEAQRDYWIAHAELERAVGGRLPAPVAPDAQAPVKTSSDLELNAVKPSGHEHH